MRHIEKHYMTFVIHANRQQIATTKRAESNQEEEIVIRSWLEYGFTPHSMSWRSSAMFGFAFVMRHVLILAPPKKSCMNAFACKTDMPGWYADRRLVSTVIVDCVLTNKEELWLGHAACLLNRHDSHARTASANEICFHGWLWFGFLFPHHHEDGFRVAWTK